ncbi:dienelactone hydrolase family protein [Paenibacillus lutrae]|uniref:Alpha/beta fold hydrolase n=1 Tax=Paenibacillus lutrae TaxID=2078573 RepID=A0A7X3FFH3_9BACL|nr:alpha/beta fold hydrolase [Paenibacillus lutrae]MVO98645.1 alpha/beta fold hydrolase [Paenibacillus lutrae]
MSYKLSERTLDTLPRLLEGIATTRQWQAKRSRIEAQWLQLLGKAPAAEECPRDYDIVMEEAEGGCLRRDIRYQTADGDHVTATLLLPDSCLTGKKRHPAVLALHPTAEEGRLDTASPSGRENRRYGLELAARGYVVLAPDSITCGSRIYPGSEAFQTAPFYEEHPEWTAVGKMLLDHMRAVDLLSSLPEVDGGRIGAIGHSLGGYNGWFLAGLDRRIKAVASSCGFSMFTEDPDPNRWGQRDWFSHLPALTESIREDRIPFEWHEIAALAAPTPLWMWSGMGDTIFPNWPAIGAGMNDLATVYGLLGQVDAYEFWMGHGGHDFPDKARSLAYDFLDAHLKQGMSD